MTIPALFTVQASQVTYLGIDGFASAFVGHVPVQDGGDGIEYTIDLHD